MIIACLAWYDETPETLTRCVQSLAENVDYIVAYDGAWNGYPGGAGSPREQVWAIDQAAAATPLRVHVPRVPWESQVAKRAALMEHGSRVAGNGGWLLVIDADEYVERANWPALRETLTDTTRDVATVGVHNLHDGRGQGLIRRLYRANPHLTVRTAHMGYCIAGPRKPVRWLHGDTAYVRLERPERGTAKHLVLAHDRNARTEARQAARREYRMHRNRTQCEKWKRAA